MTNYVKTTNFTAKDSLISGDPGKLIKGYDFDVEFDSLVTAVGSKADSYSGTFTGIPTAPTASLGTNTTQLATTAFVNTAVVAATGSLGSMSTQDSDAVAITGGTLSGVAVTGSLTGNASTATALATSRTISLTGDVTGSVSFNGTANASITATVADDSHNHIISNVDGLQTALNGKAPLTGTGASGTWGINITGNAATATSASSVSTSVVLTATAGATAGAVGTYLMARYTNGDINRNSTVSGSSLVSCSTAYSVEESNSGSTTSSRTEGSLSGTWRCMGTFDATFTRSSGPVVTGATLWLRIS